ncbi:MAG: winged helix-turn-helix domain-containing protein [Steroidobacteraceae bacterium]
MKPQAHVRIDFSGTCSIGPGKIGLLEGIERTGSLSAAARALGMSYRRAWLLLHSTNEGFSQPVVELSVGGKDGGGTRLTEFGRKLVADYRQFEDAVDQLAAKVFADVRVNPRASEAEPPRSERRPVKRALGPRG